jgi:hypothetical protein
MKKLYNILCLTLVSAAAFAGNPDRQGEAGANQLLINPWARCAGLHEMNTSNTVGAEAMYLNVAGLSRINKTQIQLGHTRYIAEININALGFAQKMGKGGAFGISLVALDLGDFDYTDGRCSGWLRRDLSALRTLIWDLSYSHLVFKQSLRGCYR